MNVQALKKECHKSLFQTEFVLNVNWITLLLLLDSCGHHSLALCGRVQREHASKFLLLCFT